MNDAGRELFEYARDITDAPMLSLPNGNTMISEHFHRQMEIIYVTKGKIEISINKDKTVLYKDQFAICDSYDIHTVKTLTPEKSASIGLIIPYTTMKEYNAEKQSKQLKEKFITDKNVARKIKAFIDLLYDYWEPAAMNNTTTHICQALLSVISKEIGFTSIKRDGKRFFHAELLQYITNNISDDLDISTVAAKFGYNKYYFSKMFAHSFNISFNDFVKLSKAQYAIKLIRTEKISVLEAAMRAGFNSEATFYRFIKSNMHCTPKQLLLRNEEPFL